MVNAERREIFLSSLDEDRVDRSWKLKPIMHKSPARCMVQGTVLLRSSNAAYSVRLGTLQRQLKHIAKTFSTAVPKLNCDRTS